MSIQIKKDKTKTYGLVLVFFLLLNFVTTGGHLYSIDDVQYFLHTENLALKQSIELDPYSPSVSKLLNTETLRQIQGKHYSFQGKEWTDNTPLSPYVDGTSLFLPFATVPLYYLSTVISTNPETIMGFFTNSIIISLTSLAIFMISVYFFRDQRIAFILASAYNLTTFVWSYNTGMMLGPIGGLMFTLGFYLIITSKSKNHFRAIIAGTCTGLSLLASSSSIIVVPGLILFGIFYLYKSKNQVILFLVGVSILMIIQAFLNIIRFNSVTDFGFGWQQNITTHSHIDGIIGYIFSLGWGIPFNAPLLILFPISIYLIWKKNKILAVFLSYCFLITWIFHGTEISPNWSGYGGWGPRYFITILPLMIISLGFTIQKFYHNQIFRISFIGLALVGFFVNFIGKLVWYIYGYSYGWEIMKTHLMENSWLQLNYNFQYAPITLHLLVLNSDYLKNLGIPTIIPQAWGLSPCPYDLFIYCNWGIIPLIGILIALSIIGYIILKILLVDQISNINLSAK